LHSYRRLRGGATAAAAETRRPSRAGATRVMHKTLRHAHLEHRRATGAVLPPRETGRVSERAHARRP